MKIAIVVIRYGLEVNGGAELHARQIAERLTKHMQVDVLTTCAMDVNTWANDYPAGLSILNQVPVRRFPVIETRDMAEFGRYSLQVAHGARTIYDEAQWMRAQGPHAPLLTQYIREHADDYDYFLFFSYLYATTYAALPLVSGKSILQPLAHDEDRLYFDIFRPIFNLPRGIIYNTPEEKQLVQRVFGNDHIPSVVLGVGIEVPQPPAAQVIRDDFVIYMGRVDAGKGCDQLLRYFLHYKEQTRDTVKLVLIGAQAMPVPHHPDIVVLGFLPGDERFAWLSEAQLLVVPSRYESLSLVTLEAWGMGVTALVNGASEVLKGHCLRGNGGLYYENEAEFIEALKLLRQQPDLRAQLGRQGQAYVQQHYSWERIEAGYLYFLQHL